MNETEQRKDRGSEGIGETVERSEEVETMSQEGSLNSEDSETGPEDITSMAIQILKVGVMPLCPPGRRNYLGNSTLTISVGEREVDWPPKNLSQMTPDEKLLAWEYFAMALHHQFTREFPTMSRQRLLDTYNFLALPGTRKAYDRQDRECRKVRYYNYQLLRAVAKGDLKSEEAEDLVKMLYLTMSKQHKTRTVQLAETMSLQAFPLRLDSE